MKDFISIQDLTTDDLLELVKRSQEMNSGLYPNNLAGKIVALAFFQPSTRTRIGCEAAVKRLGGQCIQLGDNSSMRKGEDFEDTIKTLAEYVDCIVIRHPEEGSAKKVADWVNVPIINGGDGRNELPTAALTLFYQIFHYAKRCKKGLNEITVLFYGPLKYCRLCHSLIPILARFGMKTFSDCPNGLELPNKSIELIKNEGINMENINTKNILSDIDVLVACAVEAHKEAYTPAEYDNALRFYSPITKDFIKKMKSESIIMAIPPRVWEVSKDVDDDPRQVYTQVPRDSMHTRMALFATLLT